MILVFGNGDIYDVGDVLVMMFIIGCDGVVIGCGCLGCFWLFVELFVVFIGSLVFILFMFGEVVDIICCYGILLVVYFGEDKGMCDICKYIVWYFYGFLVGFVFWWVLVMVKMFDEFDCLLDWLDGMVLFLDFVIGVWGWQGFFVWVVFFDGWLIDFDDC